MFARKKISRRFFHQTASFTLFSFFFFFFLNLIFNNLLILDMLDICQRTAFHHYIKSKYVENFVVFSIQLRNACKNS